MNIQISPMLTSNKVNILMKETYSKASKIPYMYNVFNNISGYDAFKITKKIDKLPDLYGDMLSGKIKLFLNGLTDKPFSLVTPEAISPQKLKQQLGKDSIITKIINVFDAVDKDKKTVNKISMQSKDERIKIMTFGFDSQPIDEYNLAIIDKENPFIKMMNASDNKRIDIIRD